MEYRNIEILLAEDNPNDAELTMRALRKSKIINPLIHLTDGVEAVDFIFGTGRFTGRDVNNKLKLVLLDLKMPRMDGMEVLARIKGDERTRDIPVVVLTSSGESPDLEKCYALGANSYIVKPVEFEGFTKAVQDVGMYWMLLNELPV